MFFIVLLYLKAQVRKWSPLTQRAAVNHLIFDKVQVLLIQQLFLWNFKISEPYEITLVLRLQKFNLEVKEGLTYSKYVDYYCRGRCMSEFSSVIARKSVRKSAKP